MEHNILKEKLVSFAGYLRENEKGAGTVDKYLRDAGGFAAWLGEREMSRDAVAGWRERLVEDGYKPKTVNSMVAAVNAFLRFLGREDCRVKSLKIQRSVFREENRELTREEYGRLLRAAADKPRLELILETICATGIRVSEVRYVTVEAAKAERADISLKGKIRTILLPRRLCRKLLKYAKAQKIASGEIFLTRSGKPVTRRQIWAEMKGLCDKAGVERSKVFPHNLRHLFARMFYKVTRDIAKLSDVLGHSSIETTRVYLISTGAEHARTLERLGLVT